MKAVVDAFNQEKALVGAFSVIIQLNRLIVNRFAALLSTVQAGGAEQACGADHDLLHAVLHAAGAAGLLLRPVVSSNIL